ncbi:mitochondrial carrier [Linderina pennispora]|uniref:Mitochondrial carrier n=1 Tax=Linderina pennispora TaxID=61395 RepID=A0A1Y1W5P7_9FUNG|nr:mitochondrial carrier [Linderina pennispora]ORX68688.1 mitochondrial carrier [Linderina pennispora]
MATTRDRVAGFASGIASGATKLFVGHPFDTVKIRCQVEGGHGRFKGPLDCLMSTIRQEGPRALYKGASIPLIGWAAMDAVQLGSLSNYRLLLQGGNKAHKLTHLEHAVAGMGAGWTVAMVATPVELIKVRLQVQYASGDQRRYGVFGIWHGLPATLTQRSFFFFLWGSYDVYSEWMRTLRRTDHFPYYAKTGSKLINFLAGGMAANTFWCMCYPVDVVKNRYMTQGDESPISFRRMFAHVYRTEGVRGFFRGFVPTFIRSFPTNASAIFVWESTMRFLKNEGHH